MKKNMSLQRAIRLGLIKDCDIVDPKALFSSSSGMISISADETGYWRTQRFDREKLKWYYMEVDNIPYIVSEIPLINVIFESFTSPDSFEPPYIFVTFEPFNSILVIF